MRHWKIRSAGERPDNCNFSFPSSINICKSRFHSLADPVNTTDPTNTTLCECECWLYNMLYGTSGWNNLTYAEKEEALSEITNEVFHTNKPIKWTFSNNERHLYSLSLQYLEWDLGLEQPRICGEVRGFVGGN